jgi:hypothetical protein
LLIDLVDQSLPDVLEARLLGLRVRIGEGSQPNRPGVSGQLVPLPVGKLAEEREAAWTAISSSVAARLTVSRLCRSMTASFDLLHNTKQPG